MSFKENKNTRIQNYQDMCNEWNLLSFAVWLAPDSFSLNETRCSSKDSSACIHDSS